MNVPTDSRKEENAVQHSIESQESRGENPVSNIRLNELNPEKTPISNVARSRSSSSCLELSLPNSRGTRSTIPKHITTFDEKYVLGCLELLRNCALRAAASSFASRVHISPDDFATLAETKYMDSHDMAKLAIECPSVNSSQSMINILNSTLLQKSGSVDFDFVRKSDLPEKEVTVVDRKNHVSPPGHKRVVSTISSTNTSCSDKSSSSGSATSYQGMLQCTWKDGLPRYVFSVDDKTEVYIANFSKVELSNDKFLDYVYTFSTRKKEVESQCVGTMRVSTSITFCSNSSSEVRETRFVLSLSNEDPVVEVQISNHNHKKSKRLTSKVAKVFRSSHSYKQRSRSKFSWSSAILENSPWEPSENAHKRMETRVGKDCYVPNFELAAVIVKEVCKNRKEDDPGGWGLKFLRKSGKGASLKTILPSECTRNYSECSTSLDVLIPAGIHGGPMTRFGGPSSLTERWISGGRCDCGGWDVGCPLTVLNVGSRGTNSSAMVDNSEECKSIDLFMQGSKQDYPILKMANINEDLHYIHFQSTLSGLQSFAIAAAIIHSRNPVLRSKVYRT